MKLHLAMTLAERVQRELQPFCHKCEIAGSIRRARPEVNDIDFVVLPKLGQEAALRERIKAKVTVVSDGPQVMIVRLKNTFQIDVYFARTESRELFKSVPTNFGAVLLVRTGSKEHNVKLCSRAKAQGKAFKAADGIWDGGEWIEDDYVGGNLVASETEEQIFQALGLEWISPALRETTFSSGPSIPEILKREAGAAPALPGSAVQPVSGATS